MKPRMKFQNQLLAVVMDNALDRTYIRNISPVTIHAYLQTLQLNRSSLQRYRYETSAMGEEKTYGPHEN